MFQKVGLARIKILRLDQARILGRPQEGQHDWRLEVDSWEENTRETGWGLLIQGLLTRLGKPAQVRSFSHRSGSMCHLPPQCSALSVWHCWATLSHRAPRTICQHWYKSPHRTSLETQWLGIRLPTQGTWGRSLVWEDSTCSRVTKPVSHNYGSPRA